MLRSWQLGLGGPCLAVGVVLAGVPLGCWAQLPALRAVPSAAQVDPGQASATGRITGQVFDVAGAMAGGAQVTLSFDDGTPTRSAVSDRDGRYSFDAVPPGAFHVLVSLPGFDRATVAGSLTTGQSYVVPPVVLRLASVNVTVDAVVAPQVLAEEQLKAEEGQRLVGLLPNFFVSYNWKAPPLSTRQKFTLSYKNASDPGNLALVAVVSGVQQADDAFEGYGQGAQGYGKRYGANAANLVSGTFLGGAILPWIFHQDPRYFYKGTGTVRARALYAISTAVICRGDNGKRQFAWAGVLGDLSSGAVSNLYYPDTDRHGAGLTVENGFLGIAGDAMNNVFQEFFLQKLTHRKEKQAKPSPQP